jgi:hypothetical protein
VKQLGIEIDPDRAARAKEGGIEIVGSDWRDTTFPEVDLVVLMPGRLIEAEDAAPPLIVRCEGTKLLVYAYGDWLEKYASLESLCRAAGLRGQLTERRRGAGVEAGMWKFEK